MSRIRKTEVRNCKGCDKEFSTNRSMRECWSCINARRRGNCIDCNDEISGRAKRCRSCDSSRKDRIRLKPGDERTTANGYVMEYAPDHIKARKGFRAQHSLVMEAHIGRILVKGETVHHKNGVRNDNRIENLELWAKPQPSGIRASDLLEWAKSIVKQYGPIEEKIK